MNVQETQIFYGEEQFEKRKRGNSWLKTNLGSVNLHETIDPYGNFQFATETGSVSVFEESDGHIPNWGES